ncbi:MAG: class I SAM-dependent methyltransferase [Planctomycetes bacterium]|nr:class I SAM-dependent methyltransferase [Planctomycetota bacterium]
MAQYYSVRQQEQSRVRAWFEETYSKRGVGYLRPESAYPIYLQLLGARAGQHLLDVGSGPGQLLKAAVHRGLTATGVDLSSTAIGIAKGRVPQAVSIVGNAETLAFADDTFDFVTCIGSLERMLDRKKVLAEMRRVAKPGARMCFLVRNREHATWRLWHRGLGQRNEQAHQDALALEEWLDLFASCGLEVERVLPDQWPRQRLRRWVGRKTTPGVDEPVHEGRFPVRWALEFLLLVRTRER